MAVSSISSSSSIYGTRNVLSGLASGMDTESMIENAVSGYKSRISSLNQQRTKTLWQQDMYRSMINKMSSFLSKYTSYQSTTNLMSSSFWNQAVNTVAKGANASKVSATGKSSNNVQIDRVLQLATSATYKFSGSNLDRTTSAFGSESVTAVASGTLDLDGKMEISGLSGSLTLAYGGTNSQTKLKINFDDTTLYEGQVDENGNEISAEQALVNEINRQLETQSVTIGSTTYTGKELTEKVVRAELKDGKITFADPKGNNVYVSSASGDAEALLGGKEVSSVYDKQVKELTVSSAKVGSMLKTGTMDTLAYLKNKGATLNITVDGVSKDIKMPSASDIEGYKSMTTEEREKAYLEALQSKLDSAFGKGKLTVSNENTSGEGGIQFKFEAAKGSTFTVSSDQGKAMGFGESGKVTSYLNTGKSLGELLGEDKLSQFATGEKDKDGNDLYSFKVNGVEIGQFTKNSTLNDIMNAMNNNSASGVSVSYSKITNELTFTSKDTGASSEIKFDGLSAELFGRPEDSTTYTKGQNAIFEASINGTSLGQMERSSNSVDLDGMTVTLKGTFGYETDENGNVKYETLGQATDSAGNLLFSLNFNGVQKQISAKELEDGTLEFYDEKTGKTVIGTVGEDGNLTFKKNGETVYARIASNGDLTFSDTDSGATIEAIMNKRAIADTNTEAVTFETTSDAGKLIDVIKQMVEDYNAMATEIKNAYSTMPLQRSNGSYYEPLTEDDEADMSESAAKSWTENAKTGILFGDGDLRNLYSMMTNAINMTGELGATLRSAGITVNYADGLTTLSFDEDKFRTALENNPDKVRDAFTASTSSGSSEDGLLQALKVPLEMYGKTSGGKGILVEKAGSTLAASTLYSNDIQRKLDNIDAQIQKWQDLMSNKIDYYTNQFTRLEQLIMQMNSQSSYFSQLTGY